MYSSSKLDLGSYIISAAKTASKKIEALIHSMKFLSPEVVLYLCESTMQSCMEYCCHSISVNLPCSLAWNTVVIYGLVCLVATWNCWNWWIGYKDIYAGLEFMDTFFQIIWPYKKDFHKTIQGISKSLFFLFNYILESSLD